MLYYHRRSSFCTNVLSVFIKGNPFLLLDVLFGFVVIHADTFMGAVLRSTHSEDSELLLIV